MSFTPAPELAGTTGHRTFGFLTPDERPYEPATTGFTSSPAFPDLADGPAPVVVLDPTGGASVADPIPIELAFSGGPFEPDLACGEERYSEPFEVFTLDDGPPGATVMLYQPASGESTLGTLRATGDVILMTDGGGPGWQESYEVEGEDGEYLYRSDAGDCPFSVTMTSGHDELLERFAGPEPVTATSSPTPPTTNDDGAGADESATARTTDTALADDDSRDETSGRDGAGTALILLTGGGVVIAAGTLAWARSRKRRAKSKE